MNYLIHTTCCGLREMAGLQSAPSAEGAVLSVVKCMQPHTDPSTRPTLETRPRDRFRYIVFSGIQKNDYRSFAAGRASPYPPGNDYGIGDDYVEKLRDYIRSEGLGTVSETGYDLNPNSGHQLKVCVWTLDHPAIEKWAADRKLKIKPMPQPVATAVVGPAVLEPPF